MTDSTDARRLFPARFRVCLSFTFLYCLEQYTQGSRINSLPILSCTRNMFAAHLVIECEPGTMLRSLFVFLGYKYRAS